MGARNSLAAPATIYRLAPADPSEPLPRAQEPHSELSEILRKVWRKKLLILVSAATIAVFGALAGTQLTPKYEASAQIIVGVPPDRVATMESVVTDVAPDIATVQNEAYRMQSRDLAAEVVDRLHLDQDPEFNAQLRTPTTWQVWSATVKGWVKDAVHQLVPPERLPESAPPSQEQLAERVRQRIISALLSEVDVGPLGRSHVLTIDVESQSPETAAQIANTLAQVYVEDQRRKKEESTQQASNWLDTQIDRMREQVLVDEKAVEDYRRANGLYEGEASTVTAQQVTELNTQLLAAQGANADAQARLAQAKALLDSPSTVDTAPAAIASPLVQALKQQLAAAEAKAAELSTTYGEQHPFTRTSRAEIANIQGKIQTEITKIIAGLRNEARTTQARYRALRKDFERIQADSGDVNERTIKLRALEREAAASRTLFENFLSRSKETTAQQSIQQPDARIVSPAVVPESPSFPPKMLLLAAGLLGGGLVGLLLAFLIEHLDRTFRRSDQVEALTGLPTMAMVPVVRRGRLQSAQVLDAPFSPYREALRKLHAALMFADPEKTPRTLMIASAAPREGKSSLCGSLARLLAKSGRRVVIVDCDLRRPQLHRLFSRRNRVGIAELLRGEAEMSDILHRDPASGVDMIFAGRRPTDPANLSGSARMAVLLRSLAETYDFVLIDTPPILVGAEVLHLAHLVDSTVFVVRWGHTHRDAVVNALRQLVEVHGRIAGIVLSRVDPRRYRYYGYGDLNHRYTAGIAAVVG